MVKLRDPRVAGAALAVAVRAFVSWQAWHRNEIVSSPRLDAEYYLGWARDIAAGDVLGRHGTLGGDPFLLNPLYAYAIAPIVAVFGAVPGPVLVAQAILAGATAALTADAARRFAGGVAAWVAAIAVAFSAALTHLDGHVAVSGLAAFLVAGLCWTMSPGPDASGGAGRGHGPLAAGVWLGLSALARPVLLLAAPFIAWRWAREGDRRFRALLLVAAPLALCASLSLARNVAVSGEPVVFTAANGQNLYLGNNAAARRMRAMFTDEFRFSPREMHEDGKFRVAAEGEAGAEPSRSSISSWYAARATAEFAEHPAESVAWYATKARWFLSSAEPASSADYDYDLGVTPALGLAFVPTWLLVAAAAAGIVVCRARRELLLGPGAIVLSHVVAATVVFPLSHYRSPAIPAMAVLAGCAVAAAAEGLRRGSGRATTVVALVAAGAAFVGGADPQPAYRRDALLVNGAVADLRNGALDAAERGARAALTIESESVGALTVLMDVERLRGRPDAARRWAERRAATQPWNPLFRVDVARCDFDAGRRGEALAELDRLVTAFPWSATLRARRGELRCDARDLDGAREDLRFAVDRGASPDVRALRACGLASGR